MTIPNRIILDDLPTLPVGEIAERLTMSGSEVGGI